MNNKRSSGNKLDNYLRSHKTVLPKDAAAYKGPSGDKRALCLFCDRVHDNNAVLVWSFSGQIDDYNITDTFCCDACNNTISGKDVEDEAMAEVTHRAAVRKNRHRNVGHYVRDGIFPLNAYRHVTHIGGGDLANQTARFDQCVFCDEKVFTSEILGKRLLQLPVGLDIYHVDGGKVPVCGDCMELVHMTIPELSFESWLHNTFSSAQCPVCGETHLVTAEEDEMRSITKAHGEYMCGQCAYHNLNKDGTGMLHIRRQDVDGRYSRYVEMKCEYCADDFSADQMLSASYLFRKHVTAAGKLVCDDCGYKNNQPISSLRFDEVVWTFYQLENDEFIGAMRKIGSTHKQVRSFYTTEALFKFFEQLENEYRWK